jgi:hypothetical protein
MLSIKDFALLKPKPLPLGFVVNPLSKRFSEFKGNPVPKSSMPISKEFSQLEIEMDISPFRSQASIELVIKLHIVRLRPDRSIENLRL